MRLLPWVLVVHAVGLVQAEITVPASTAYLNPDQGGARVSAQQGVIGWVDPETEVVWYGQLNATGRLLSELELRLPAGQAIQLQLTIAEQNGDTTETLKQNAIGTGDRISVSMGSAKILKTGYYSFRLRFISEFQTRLNVEQMKLSGNATADAHFNLKPRRNAASVHLMYPIDRSTDVSAFYCEMTGLEDPLWSYYMACGWHRGYFGMQVNSPTERRIIFSVWDSGNEAIDRDKVAEEDRVTLVDKGEGVYSGDFGNEGTGGHSHLKFMWETGERQKFLVTAQPVSETHTVYSGYYFRRDQQEWMLISSWKAPGEGGYMRGLYSFSENFVGSNGHVVRKAKYGNQWIRMADGTWRELTTARFSHDVTGRSDRRDRFMGKEDGEFFLAHGGFREGFTEFGTSSQRRPTGRSPASMKLPVLPPPEHFGKSVPGKSD